MLGAEGCMVTIGSSLLAGTSQEIALEAFIHAVPESGERRELSDSGPAGTTPPVNVR